MRKITPSEELYVNRKAYWLPEHGIRELEREYDISIERRTPSVNMDTLGLIGKTIFGVSAFLLLGDMASSMGILNFSSPLQSLLSSLHTSWSYAQHTLVPFFFSFLKYLSLLTFFGAGAMFSYEYAKEIKIKINHKDIFPNERKQ